MAPLITPAKLALEWAPTSGPLTVSPTWAALTTRARRGKIDRGRGDERDSFREGRGVFTCKNTDRALEPEYAAGAWYPNVLPNKQVRLTCLVGANLLSHDTATMRDSIGTWTSSIVEGTSYTGTVTLAWNARGRDGIGCLRALITTTPSPIFQTASGTAGAPVTAGSVYSVLLYTMPDLGATPSTCVLRVTWYTAAGAYLSQDSSIAGVAEVAGVWTKVSGTVTAPATAAFAALRVAYTTGATAGDKHYVDQAAILPGTTSTFAYGTVPVFRGLIDSIRPSYTKGVPAPTGGDAEVEIACTDLTKILAAYRLTSPFDTQAAALAPTHWWRFDEAQSETVMRDSGATALTGVWTDNAQLGGAPMVTARDRTSVKVDGATLAGQVTGDVLTSSTWSVALSVGEVADTANHTDLVTFYGSTLAASDAGLDIDALVSDTTVTLQVTVNETDTNLMTGNNVVLFGTFARVGRHHITVTKSGTTVRLYVDGVEADNDTAFTWVARSRGVLVGLETADVSKGAQISDLMIFDGTALTAANALALAAAATAPWAGDSVAARAGRILDQVGIPAALRNIDPETTMILGAQVDPIDGVTALDYLRILEATEAGRLYVSAAGVITLLGRHATLFATSASTWGDDPSTTSTELRYADLTEDFSERRLTNRVTVQRQGGTPQTFDDTTSQTAYGVHEDRKTGLMLADDNLSRDLAAWTVDHYKNPLLRFEQVTLYGHRAAAYLTEVAVRDLGDRVTIKRRPPGGGAVQSKDVHIEGVSHDIDLRAARSWTAPYALSPADPNTYWILGDTTLGVLGSTSRLGF